METQVVRIQRKAGKVVQDCDIYIGRACFRGGWELEQSKWHNPFSVGKYGLSRAISKYEAYVRASGLIADIEELRGQTLGCWCKPGPCHGDVLVKMLEEA